MPEVQDRAAATGRREATGRQTRAEQGRAEAPRLHNGHSRRGVARRRAAGSVPAVRLEHHVERVKRRAPARPPESNGTRNGAAGSRPVINDLWYKNSVIYCLSVGTFMDSNGDGIGDFEGLMRRLDYLQGLGITAIWLMPFQTSPGEDDGYDVSDYYGVHPAYGTLGDFVEFTHAAKQRGIRVIIDLVVNHTSDQHPWFQQARRDPASKYRDWYVWSEKKPPNANEGMVFPGVQKSTWSYDSEARAWYFHRFYDFQPDLNTSNPHVQAEILKIMGFWIQLGVSGFRMDAVPFVINTKGPRVKKPMEQYDLLRTLRAFLQWRVGDSIILAEANVLPDTDLEYFGQDGDRMHMMFNFQVNQNLFYALAASDRRPLARALKATMRRPETAQWCLFLRNHDELDLGRLTDEQRQRVFQCFGPEETMQLYKRGIRRRLAPMLNGDRRLLELAYSLMFTLPGTPVLRYGDEIGMGDDLGLPERNCSRTPMQWSAEPHGGFTKADKPVVPVISEGPFGYQHVNAAMQRRDPGSLLNWTERIIRMRKEVPEVGWGDFEVLPVRDPAILVMRYDWRNNSTLFVHNLSDSPREVSFDSGIPGPEGRTLANVLSEHHSFAAEDGKHRLLLEAYGYRWFRVGGLDYLLKRSDIETPPRG
jgi:maltose alpha-D-glucosyltransferase / alpha-amylase